MPDIIKPILAIETSGEICGVSVYFSDKKFFEINIMEKNVHSEKLLEAVEGVLKLGNCKLEEIGVIAISSGPGSFTGLRIGMSAAKGLAFGLGIPIITVATFEALALQISSWIGYNTKFVICNKVNNEELYIGKFICIENGYKILEEVKVIKTEQLEENITDYSLLFGNFKDDFNSEKIHRYISSPTASFISKWAYIFGKDSLIYNYDFLEPDYLKNFIVR